ncbi:putative nuclease HARBI1 [Trichonephila clavipes]|nr:putative nuclease HARBI1 [Trichonephila clavipes]
MSEELVLSGVLVLSKVIKKELIRRQNAKRKKRKVWVKPWVGRRTEYGASHTLLKELKNEDHTAYRNMLRITGEQFDELLEMVRGKLSKQDTTVRMAIPVTTKLEITLRYLATGDSFKSLEYLFRVPETTISRFLPHVLTEICCVLRPFINVPTTVEEWKKIEKVFLQRWNFPRCCGAIDGEVTPGQWRLHANTLRPVTSLGSNNPNRTAIQIRQQFMKYFTEENPLPWQWEKLGLKRP